MVPFSSQITTLAWLISAAYNRWVRGDLFWGLVFCYLGYMLFNSLMMYQLFGPQPFFVVIAFWFCTGRGRRIKIKWTSGR